MYSERIVNSMATTKKLAQIKDYLAVFSQYLTKACLTRKRIEPVEGKRRRNSRTSIIVCRLLNAAEIQFTEKDTLRILGGST